MPDDERGSGFVFYESMRTGMQMKFDFSVIASYEGFRIALKDHRGDPVPGGTIGAARGTMDACDLVLSVFAPDMAMRMVNAPQLGD